MENLNRPPVECDHLGEIAVLRFPQPTQLLGGSPALNALAHAVRSQNESRVLIDLLNVTRIDSAAIGVLMNCYCHTLKNSVALKLVNPTGHVKHVLRVSRIDTVIETFDDQASALDSFNSSAM